LEVAIGTGKKERLKCEMPAYKFARRSIVSVSDITAGTIIQRSMLDMKRPGTGLSSEFMDRFIGRKARHDIAADTLLNLEDVE